MRVHIVALQLQYLNAAFFEVAHHWQCKQVRETEVPKKLKGSCFQEVKQIGSRQIQTLLETTLLRMGKHLGDLGYNYPPSYTGLILCNPLAPEEQVTPAIENVFIYLQLIANTRQDPAIAIHNVRALKNV